MPELSVCFMCDGSGETSYSPIVEGIDYKKKCPACKGNGKEPATLSDLHAVLLEIKARLDLIYEKANG